MCGLLTAEMEEEAREIDPRRVMIALHIAELHADRDRMEGVS